MMQGHEADAHLQGDCPKQGKHHMPCFEAGGHGSGQLFH